MTNYVIDLRYTLSLTWPLTYGAKNKTKMWKKMTQILLVFNVSSCLTATNNFVFFYNFIVLLFWAFSTLSQLHHSTFSNPSTNFQLFFCYLLHQLRQSDTFNPLSNDTHIQTKRIHTPIIYFPWKISVAHQTGQRHYDVWILLCRWIFLITFTMSMTEELQKFPDRDLTEGMGIC